MQSMACARQLSLRILCMGDYQNSWKVCIDEAKLDVLPHLHLEIFVLYTEIILNKDILCEHCVNVERTLMQCTLSLGWCSKGLVRNLRCCAVCGTLSTSLYGIPGSPKDWYVQCITYHVCESFYELNLVKWTKCHGRKKLILTLSLIPCHRITLWRVSDG